MILSTKDPKLMFTTADFLIFRVIFGLIFKRRMEYQLSSNIQCSKTKANRIPSSLKGINGTSVYAYEWPPGKLKKTVILIWDPRG